MATGVEDVKEDDRGVEWRLWTVEVVQSCDVMPTLHTPRPVSVSSNLPPEQQPPSHFILDHHVQKNNIVLCVDSIWFRNAMRLSLHLQLCVGDTLKRHG